MTAYQFSQPWISAVNGEEAMNALEWAHLRQYLQGVDNGTIPLFNPNFINLQVNGASFSFPVTVPNGGTGLTTLTSGSYIKGAGTSNVTFQAVPIPVADGGTNSTTALNNGRVIGSSSGKIVELSLGQIPGTATNDNASAGNMGEYIESVISTINFPSSNVVGDATSISLTAGDWDIAAFYMINRNGATVTNMATGVTTTSGNSTTGRVYGSNWVDTDPSVSLAYDNFGIMISSIRASLSGTTTYYMKYQAGYSAATPRLFGARLSARRMR